MRSFAGHALFKGQSARTCRGSMRELSLKLSASRDRKISSFFPLLWRRPSSGSCLGQVSSRSEAQIRRRRNTRFGREPAEKQASLVVGGGPEFFSISRRGEHPGGDLCNFHCAEQNANGDNGEETEYPDFLTRRHISPPGCRPARSCRVLQSPPSSLTLLLRQKHRLEAVGCWDCCCTPLHHFL